MPVIAPGTGATLWRPGPHDLKWGRLFAWYDFSDLSTITSSGGTVSQVLDKSGNGYTLTQSTGSYQPTLTTVNGRSALLFDGTDDYMTASTGLNSSQPNTIIGVGRNAETGGTQRNMGTYAAGGGFDGRIFRTSGDLIATYAGNTVSTGRSWGTTRVHVCAFILNAASTVLYADGARATGDCGGNYQAATLTLGAYYTIAEFWKGEICEWLCFKGTVPEPVLLTLCNQLAAKWGAAGFAGASSGSVQAFT